LHMQHVALPSSSHTSAVVSAKTTGIRQGETG